MKEKTYLTSVRFHLCLKGMWADDYYIERNITSSDVEFLEGNDGEKESNGKKKGKMSKPEKRTSVVDKARPLLTIPDLSGLQDDGDVDMNDIMLVFHHKLTKGLTLSHTQPGELRKWPTSSLHGTQAKRHWPV